MKKTLLQKISSKKILLEAWGKLNKANKSSYGIDNVSIEDFSANLDDKIYSISKKLRASKYKFSQNRAVLIPKSRSEEHTSELQSRKIISYAVFCLDRKSVV